MTGLQPQAISKYKRHSLKIDMTPMVDLGFLLITFFIFTTSLAAPTITRLVMPADGNPTPVKESNTLTVLLDKHKVFVYGGQWAEANAANAIRQTYYDVTTGLGAFIRQKQKALGSKKEDLVLIIKPLPAATYQNVVAALDEVQINSLRHYALVNVTEAEKIFVANRQ